MCWGAKFVRSTNKVGQVNPREARDNDTFNARVKFSKHSRLNYDFSAHEGRERGERCKIVKSGVIEMKIRWERVRER